MGRKRKQPGAFSPEIKDAVMMELARKAAAGNMAAARLYLDEYAAQYGPDINVIQAHNARILTLADLINNPVPDRDINDIVNELQAEKGAAAADG